MHALYVLGNKQRTLISSHKIARDATGEYVKNLNYVRYLNQINLPDHRFTIHMEHTKNFTGKKKQLDVIFSLQLFGKSATDAYYIETDQNKAHETIKSRIKRR